GRELAKVLLGECLGNRRHDRVFTLAITVVTQLLEDVAPLWAPQDRYCLGVNGHAIFAVASGAGLSLGLDVTGQCRHGNSSKANPSADGCRKQTFKRHSALAWIGLVSFRERSHDTLLAEFPKNQSDCSEDVLSVRQMKLTGTKPCSAS